MDYSILTAEIKEFFIEDYSNKAADLRKKASNPLARKTELFIKAAIELEDIVDKIKATA